MDVLPHSTDIFEGPTHKEAQEAVKTRVEVEECVEDIIREVQDILYLEMYSEQPICGRAHEYYVWQKKGENHRNLLMLLERLLHGRAEMC